MSYARAAPVRYAVAYLFATADMTRTGSRLAATSAGATCAARTADGISFPGLRDVAQLG